MALRKKTKDLKQAEPVPYKVVYVTTQTGTTETVLADNLRTGEGWISGNYPNYPQEMVLDLVYMTNVVKVKLTPNQMLRAETIEVWSSRAEDRNEKKYKSLGRIEFKDKVDKKPVDSKFLFVDTQAKWLWFQFSKPKVHDKNDKNQIGLQEIQVFGYFDKPPTPPPPEDPKALARREKEEREQRAKRLGPPREDGWDEYSERLHQKHKEQSTPAININNYYNTSDEAKATAKTSKPTDKTAKSVDDGDKCQHPTMKPGDKFCAECGEKATAKGNYCGKCGTKKIAGDEFCRDCGAK